MADLLSSAPAPYKSNVMDSKAYLRALSNYQHADIFPEQIKKILNFERLGLLSEDEQVSVTEERQKDNFPVSMPLDKDDYTTFSESFDVQFMEPKEQAEMYLKMQEWEELLTRPEFLKEASATAGGMLGSLIDPTGKLKKLKWGGKLIGKFPAVYRTMQAGLFGGGAAGVAGADPGEMVDYAQREAIYQGIGEGVVKIGAKIFTKAGKLIHGGRGTVEDISIKGTTGLGKSQVTGVVAPARVLQTAPVIKSLHAAADSSWVGAGTMERMTAGHETVAKSQLDKFVNNFIARTGTKGADEVLQNTLKGGKEVWRAQVRGSYNALDDAILKSLISKGYAEATEAGLKSVTHKATELINMQPLKEAAENFLRLKMIAGGGKFKYFDRPAQNKRTKELLNQIINYPHDKIPFSIAAEFRSELLAATAPFIKTGQIPAKGPSVSGMANMFDEAMEQASKQLDAETYEVWRTANRVMKEGSQKFDNEFITELVEASPDSVFNLAIGKKAGKWEDIRKLREIVTTKFDKTTNSFIPSAEGKRIWQNMQGEWMERAFKDATAKTKKGIKVFDGNKLTSYIDKFGGRKNRALKELFPEGEFERFERLARNLAYGQKTIESKGGTVAMNILQIGGIGGILTGAAFSMDVMAWGGFGLAFAAPWTVAKFMANPYMAKALTTGVNAPAGSAKATNAGMHLLAGLVLNDYTSKEEASQIMKKAIETGTMDESYLKGKTLDDYMRHGKMLQDKDSDYIILTEPTKKINREK